MKGFGINIVSIKKAILFIVIGIPIIIAVLLYCIFGSMRFSKLISNEEYVFSANDVVNHTFFNNGISIENDVWESKIDDASITIKLERSCKIKAFTISFIKSSNTNCQIYLSDTSEMRADVYAEFIAKEGDNIIAINYNKPVSYIRFDLTDKVSQSFQLRSVSILTNGEHRILFWITALLLLPAYILGVLYFTNKLLIKQYIKDHTRVPEYYGSVSQLFALALSDFRSRFSGSYLGVFWGVIQPLSTILLFWFVFQVGFRSNPVDDVPFILWLAAGMIPWNYFYDSWFGGTNSFVSYSYIVKKVVFKIDVLPLVKALSSFFLNIIFNIILLLIYCLYGKWVGFHIFDMIYFSACVFMLTLALSYITATLNVFVKDVGQFMGIILQILMWTTPMMWSYKMIPDKYSLFYKLNPIHYIINGYRESLINGHWFFYQKKEMIWFWFVTIILFCIGRKLMRKMQDQFADVL